MTPNNETKRSEYQPRKKKNLAYPGGAHKGGEILWDHDGVPHIYGANEREMYYAFGWAQMHNHANLILQLYAQARGRAAEYFGEAYLPLDKKIRLFNVPEQALKWIK
jgi:acyl-homoserine-lactone acylase